VESDAWRTWREAMADALYGAGGFYTSSGAPGRHFRTAAHVGAVWARAVFELAQRVDASLASPDDFAVIDVGAGGGELLRALSELAPDRWSLLGIDVAPRPDGLPQRVGWSSIAPTEVVGLLIAVELLDVVPVDVVELTEDGPRVIEVAADADERIGSPIDATQLSWLSTWWPLDSIGDRAEIGSSRDAMWRSLVDCVTAGAAVAIDYPAVPTRDIAGTLTGYRDGQQVLPIPDGSCDITAHVLFESLVADGDRQMTQRDALRQLGVDPARPTYGDDPAAYLATLSAVGDAAELLDPAGLGGFQWLLHAVGIPQPFEVVS
jgi:SAM-dependent MidA family methyltransferase